MGQLWNDPDGLRERAEETRAHAMRMLQPEARVVMLEIAAAYEDMAEEAEAWYLEREGQR